MAGLIAECKGFAARLIMGAAAIGAVVCVLNMNGLGFGFSVIVFLLAWILIAVRER